VKSELEGMWKKALLTYLGYFSDLFPEETEGTY